MANHTITQAEFHNKPMWSGGRSPFDVSYGKLMMWIFLLSDAFTFSCLLVQYGAQRFSNVITPITSNWPTPAAIFNHFPFLHGLHLPLLFVSVMTFILILSSVTMVLAVEAGHRNSKKEVEKYMIYTILGGFAFLGCQAWEWVTFIHEGARLNENKFGITEQGYAHLNSLTFGDHFEWENGDRTVGPVPFAALFFIVTGFHGFHVFSGVVINVIIYIMTVRGVFERRGHYEMIEKTGLYWHFVDLVWVFVFTFFYLI
ncbi:MAG: cytochrome oxidase subunit III [Flavobacteriaceae bacterium]|nr:cytochrome oxidase subunit III [Flavobacteriaceae bacterium]